MPNFHYQIDGAKTGVAVDAADLFQMMSAQILNYSLKKFICS